MSYVPIDYGAMGGIHDFSVSLGFVSVTQAEVCSSIASFPDVSTHHCDAGSCVPWSKHVEIIRHDIVCVGEHSLYFRLGGLAARTGAVRGAAASEPPGRFNTPAGAADHPPAPHEAFVSPDVTNSHTAFVPNAADRRFFFSARRPPEGDGTSGPPALTCDHCGRKTLPCRTPFTTSLLDSRLSFLLFLEFDEYGRECFVISCCYTARV